MTWRRSLLSHFLKTELGQRLFFRFEDVFRSVQWKKHQETNVRVEMKEILELLKPANSVTLKRFGNVGDGGYAIATPILSDSVLISGGVGDNISFETDICKEVEKVFLFDYSVEKPLYLSANMVFLKKKIVSQAQSQHEIVLDNLISSLSKDSRVILKLDIEGSEWEVLDSLREVSLQKVDQLIVEFHGLLKMAYRNDLLPAIKVLRKLDTFFFPVNTHANNYGDFRIFMNLPFPDVVEVTYISKSQLNHYHSSSNPNEVNSPNNPNSPEIHFLAK